MTFFKNFSYLVQVYKLFPTVGSEENKFGNFGDHFFAYESAKICEKICKLLKFSYQGGINGAVDIMLL